ncbi:hypothetical protein GYMLUDRAFT_244758 [Collybiopsis luxurians FD-317 M1]|uniref:Uncharacterized protein n=1 Tax=Collybiopsis luxurians FD-317 M1 TaxID=944289 RepID=A0A0D0CMU9_9AGAR|nr:hypothetical protein GYMLUDRAFT_244758 [Collybiopsis luxurians FD-317 M1]
MPANVNLPVPHDQTSQPAIQLVLKRPALINLFKSTATRQPAPCLPIAINSALAPTVKPYANQLILTRTPLPALLNLAKSSYRRSLSPSHQLFNLRTWTSAMMVMTSKH